MSIGRIVIDVPFVIVLSRRMPEATTLLHALSTHPEVHGVDDAFVARPPSARDGAGSDSNLVTFMARYGSVDAGRLLPNRHRTLFRDYLEYLNCFEASRRTLLSLPYDACGILANPAGGLLAGPAVLEYARDLGVRILHLITTDPLAEALTVATATPVPAKRHAGKAVVDVPCLLIELERRRREDASAAAMLRDYEHYLAVDAADVPPAGGRRAFRAVLRDVASWLELEPRFSSSLGDVSSQSLSLSQDDIANYDQVVSALAGSAFALGRRRQTADRSASETAALKQAR